MCAQPKPYDNKNFDDQSVWIIGASSGIGAALAQELSKEGAQVILSARRVEKLKRIASECDALKASAQKKHQAKNAVILPLDVGIQNDWEEAFQTLQKQNIVPDRIIFLAALYEPMPLDTLDIEKTEKIIDVNIKGAMYLCHIVAPHFKQRGYGQIALCGSVAGYRGLPNGQPYSMTKAAIHNLTESLHTELCAYNVDVRVISPGFVRTELTDKNDFEMPFIIEPEQAARAIVRGLRKKTFNITFPFPFSFIMKILRHLPDAIFLRALRQKKASK